MAHITSGTATTSSNYHVGESYFQDGTSTTGPKGGRPVWGGMTYYGRIEPSTPSMMSEDSPSVTRLGYPGFNSKELFARDLFAHNLREIKPGTEQSVGTMLEHFDWAIRQSTAVASKRPQRFQNSDRYLAVVIAKEHSKELAKLRAENVQLHEAYKSVTRSRPLHRWGINDHSQQIKDLQGQVRGHRDIALEANARFRDLTEVNEQLLVAQTRIRTLETELAASLNPKPKDSWIKPFWATPKSLTKERPMSKLKVAAGLVAAAVFAPVVFNVAKDNWSGAYASVTAETTLEQRLAELEVKRDESLSAFAREYVAIQLEMKNATEVEAFEAAVLASLGLEKDELEATLALLER